MLFNQTDSPIRKITFGDAMQISLHNYYDILIAQAGGLGEYPFQGRDRRQVLLWVGIYGKNPGSAKRKAR